MRYTCKYLSCGKVYASSDAVRKHARNHHPEWLKQCELEQCEKRRGEKVEAYCIISRVEPNGAPDIIMQQHAVLQQQQQFQQQAMMQQRQPPMPPPTQVNQQMWNQGAGAPPHQSTPGLWQPSHQAQFNAQALQAQAHAQALAMSNPQAAQQHMQNLMNQSFTLGGPLQQSGLPQPWQAVRTPDGNVHGGQLVPAAAYAQRVASTWSLIAANMDQNGTMQPGAVPPTAALGAPQVPADGNTRGGSAWNFPTQPAASSAVTSSSVAPGQRAPSPVIPQTALQMQQQLQMQHSMQQQMQQQQMQAQIQAQMQQQLQQQRQQAQAQQMHAQQQQLPQQPIKTELQSVGASQPVSSGAPDGLPMGFIKSEEPPTRAAPAMPASQPSMPPPASAPAVANTRVPSPLSAPPSLQQSAVGFGAPPVQPPTNFAAAPPPPAVNAAGFGHAQPGVVGMAQPAVGIVTHAAAFGHAPPPEDGMAMSSGAVEVRMRTSLMITTACSHVCSHVCRSAIGAMAGH